MINKEVELVIDKICRCCMCENENMHNVFENGKDAEGSSSVLLSEMLMAFACVEVTFGDGLPYNVCDNCESKLKTAYEFRQQCQETDTALKKLTSTESKQNIAKREDNIIQPDVTDDIPIEEDGIPLNQRNFKRKRGRVQKKEDGNFACMFCNKVLHTKKGLSMHLKTHTDEKLRQCLFCDAEYTHINNLIRHIAIHDEPGLMHPCGNCDKTFSAATELYIHSQIHEQEENDKSIKTEEIEIKIEVDDNDIFNDLQVSDNGDEDSDFVPDLEKEKKPKRKQKDKALYHCKECSKVMSTSLGLKTHMRRHTGVDLSLCKLCNKSFTTVSYLKRHLRIHGIIGNERIKMSEQSTDANVKQVIKCEFNQHIQVEHDVSDGTNDVANTEELNSHINVIREDSSEANCESKQKLQEMINSGELIHQCETCEKAFTTEESFKKHVEEHISKPYVCTVCNKQFTIAEHLIKHVKLHQSNSDEVVNLKCSRCDLTFTESDHFATHIKIHESQDKRHVCDKCGKAFNRMHGLRIHQKSHTRNKDDPKCYLCVYCGKKFNDSGNIIIHMRRHTGETPYKCSECGKGFPRLHDLTCHQRMHSGEKPFLCTVCGKSFSKSNKLLRHSRIHTGERPYVCNVCGRAFIQSTDLAVHVRRLHTGARPYACGDCSASFIMLGQLKTHCKTTGHTMAQPGLKGGYKIERMTPPHKPINVPEITETKVTDNQNTQENNAVTMTEKEKGLEKSETQASANLDEHYE